MPVSCTTGVATYLSPDCNRPQPKEGGVRYLIALSSTHTITDFTNQTQWQNNLNSGDVEIVGPLVGSIPAASANKKKVDSCVPPAVTSYLRQFAFRDYNTTQDNTSFFNSTVANAAGLTFGYVTCAEEFYGEISGAALDVTRQIDENAEDGDTFWGGTLEWIELAEISPVDVSGFFSSLNYS